MLGGDGPVAAMGASWDGAGFVTGRTSTGAIGGAPWQVSEGGGGRSLRLRRLLQPAQRLSASRPAAGSRHRPKVPDDLSGASRSPELWRRLMAGFSPSWACLPEPAEGRSRVRRGSPDPDTTEVWRDSQNPTRRASGGSLQ